MQLPYKEAERCITLLTRLDLFWIRVTDVFEEEKRIDIEDFSKMRVIGRQCWQGEPEFIEKFIEANSDLTNDDVEIVIGWKDRAREDYILMKYCPQYAVFFSADEGEFYAVKALGESFKDIFRSYPPIMLETCLLPYKGEIIWDGTAAVKSASFDRESTKAFSDDFKKAEKAGALQFQL